MRLSFMRKTTRSCLTLASVIAATGCSGMVANLAADALGGGGGTFASDDDPELVREAIPFGLKTLEGLLADSPKNGTLLLAAGSGFTQYAYGFVQADAEELEPTDLSRANVAFARARKLYARGLEYSLRGLEARHPGLRAAFARERTLTLVDTDKDDVPFLYWAAAALGGRIAISKDDMLAVGRLGEFEALAYRALALDEAYAQGAIHELLIAYESRSAAMGGSPAKAKEHYERALALSGGHKLAPLVTWAEVAAVPAQDRKLFDALLARVLGFDVDSAPTLRLVNLIAQRRARFVASRAPDLFLEE